MKLIRLIVAALAMSLVFGAAATSATAGGNITKQAKKKCKKKNGKAKKKCIKKEKKRLKKQQQRQKEQRKKKPPVTIRTTEGGVPRIIAGNFRGLGYGYGFSLARQNICSMAEIYTTVRGDRSKYFGPDEGANLESDFANRRVINNGTVDRLLKLDPPNGPAPEVKKVVDGYVKGYNRYLDRTGVDNIPDETCKGEPWVKKIDKQQVYLRFFELGTRAGLGAAVDGIANAAPPGAPLAAEQPQPLKKATAANFEALNETAPDLGSNAVALGSESTDTGKGMLYGNPHFPWSGSDRFFQSQLTIPGKFNVSGASLLGTPVVLIGHTQKLAWSHTVSTARRFSFYREKLAPGDPTSYMVDGAPVKMDSTEVTVPVLQEDGSLKNETRTLYETKHGPITNAVAGQPLFPWTDDYAYAITDPNAEGLRFINHFFETNKAQSVNDLKNILNEVQGVPWVNTIAADSKGKALYSDRGVVPNLTDERVAGCNTPGLGDLAWASFTLAVLDGSTSSCDMQKAPGAVVAGVLGPEQMPLQIRNDFGSNMNDSYWLSNPKAPLTGFPSIISTSSPEETARSLRTRNGLNQIEERFAGTDGQSGNKYTFPQMRKFITNNRHYGAELLIPPLVTHCMANPVIDGVDVSAACSALAGWGLTENLDDPGSYLGRQVIDRLRRVPGGPWTAPFSLGDPVHTPNGLDTSKPEVGMALSDSVTEMQGYGIPFDASWRDYQYVTRNGEKIPIPGGSGGQGVFNVISSVKNPDTGVYDDVRHGSSFIIQASLTGAKCPPVKTILTYSQAATNEKSKHFSDQTKLFSNSEWVTDRFCDNQQKKSPGLKVAKLNGGSNAAEKGGW